MKYFIDTEFIEGSQTKRLLSIPIGKTKPTIDLISIGIVSEDGREYYAISKDFNLKEAWNRLDVKIEPVSGDMRNQYSFSIKSKVYWIRDNVLKPIWEEKCKEGFSFKNSPMTPYGIESLFTYSNFKKLLNKYGKTNKQIAQEIIMFIDERKVGNTIIYPVEQETETNRVFTKDVNFYAYYADYDWVGFCWLFGKMIDLPNGFPKYCIDLKQELERLNETLGYNKDDKGKSYRIQEHSGYPILVGEHNALNDAKWNKQLYEFLIKL